MNIPCTDSNGWLDIPRPMEETRTMTYYMKRGNKHYFRNKTSILMAEVMPGVDVPKVKYGTEVEIKMGASEPGVTRRATKKFREQLKRANKL